MGSVVISFQPATPDSHYEELDARYEKLVGVWTSMLIEQPTCPDQRAFFSRSQLRRTNFALAFSPTLGWPSCVRIQLTQRISACAVESLVHLPRIRARAGGGDEADCSQSRNFAEGSEKIQP
eukprot:1562300-Rhodomonas_salina.1